jgi:spore maturation protein CgeB
MRIVLLDTYYPDVLNSLPFDIESSYERELEAVLSVSFGTASFFSDNLRALGHECIDIVANWPLLQSMWAKENGFDNRANVQIIALAQIKAFNPDVVFIQDFSFFYATTLSLLSRNYLLCGQISCPFPREANVKQAKVIWSSFPHYVRRFDNLGVKGIYMPLAFEPRMLEGPTVARDIDISFVGGVGRQSHWQYGTDVLETVAAAFNGSFHWYGYGLDNLPASSALRACYRGPAWGRDMYEIYARSKCVVNRHGEVAQGYTNNLRCFEATGMGALLFTEQSSNLRELFPVDTVVPYSSPTHLVNELERYLGDDAARSFMALAGQHHVIMQHTYMHRMKTVSDVLQEMLIGSCK